jgi:hypothetical protein
VKVIATGRLNEAAARYGEHAPLVATCCNACRTCVTTNAIALVWAGVVGAAAASGAVVRRVVAKRS